MPTTWYILKCFDASRLKNGQICIFDLKKTNLATLIYWRCNPLLPHSPTFECKIVKAEFVWLIGKTVSFRSLLPPLLSLILRHFALNENPLWFSNAAAFVSSCVSLVYYFSTRSWKKAVWVVCQKKSAAPTHEPLFRCLHLAFEILACWICHPLFCPFYFSRIEA